MKPEEMIAGKKRPFTGQEYLDSLKDGREVYIYGERVEDVTEPTRYEEERLPVRYEKDPVPPVRETVTEDVTVEEVREKTGATFQLADTVRTIES